MAHALAQLWACSAALLAAPFALAGCRAPPEERATLRARAETSIAATPEYSKPPPASAPAEETRLPPLRAEWLVALGGEREGVVAPAVGATAARPIVVGVHGAGDRPEWSCGGWRLASQANMFVVCPRGAAMTKDTFAWSSSAQLAERVERAVARTGELFGAYVAPAPLIYAGFSQGATLAEPFLREHAARFPIAILAEGGYQISSSPAFARAFRAAGGRRLVLVCGSAACFQRARLSKTVLERAGLEVLVVGDPLAGHNLNERMQRALQGAWSEIAAPLRSVPPP